jgi:two-component sensor histidine kinase/putative methionine-R-sulfoxide reductase with GAF domain
VAVDPDKALAYQQALATFTRIIGEAGTIESLLQNTTAQVSRVTHIAHVKVLRYRPDQGDLLIVAGVGWRPGVVGHVSFSTDRYSPAGRSMQTAMPVVVKDITNDPEFRYSEVLREHGIVSVINVPISVAGQQWGVLEVDSTKQTEFEDFDVHSLSIFANILGLSIAQRRIEAGALETATEVAKARTQTDTLLRELQHRMKNNLQVILGFLSMQQRRAVGDEARERIGSVMDRVLAIGLAHDQLSFREGAGSVDLRDYLKALCANIDPCRPQVSIEVDVTPASIPLDRAVPVGLIVNELVTNAVKYAFGDAGGTITVTFRTNTVIGEAELSVRDNGRGMGPTRPGAFGLRLVESLAGQLGGRVVSDAVQEGTLTILTFPYSL